MEGCRSWDVRRSTPSPGWSSTPTRAPRADSTGRRNTSITEVCDGDERGSRWPERPAGARRQWAADRALRPAMRSPGRPEPSRAVQREFWRLIATGVTTVEARRAVGVSWPVGARWFRHAGGMPPLSLDEPTGRYLSFAEREEIALLQGPGPGRAGDRPRIGRDPSTISRELRRNAATRERQAGLPGVGGAVEGAAGARSARRPRSWSSNDAAA